MRAPYCVKCHLPVTSQHPDAVVRAVPFDFETFTVHLHAGCNHPPAPQTPWRAVWTDDLGMFDPNTLIGADSAADAVFQAAQAVSASARRLILAARGEEAYRHIGGEPPDHN